MADHDDDELKMALQMSLQPPPEAKRSKPLENAGTTDSNEAPDARARRLQREQLAAAAEKRMRSAQMNKAGNAAPSLVRVQQAVTAPVSPAKERPPPAERPSQPLPQQVKRSVERESQSLSSGQAEELYHMVLDGPSPKISSPSGAIRVSDLVLNLIRLWDWCNERGGPCGVLAAIQIYDLGLEGITILLCDTLCMSMLQFDSLALVLKYLLFMTEEGGRPSFNALLHNIGSQHISQTSTVLPDSFSMLVDHQKTRALVLAMAETLWLAGRKHRAVLASLNIQYPQREDHGHDGYDDEMMAKALEGLSINSASELQKVLRINTFTSQNALVELLKEMLPVFQSRMGALLFLFSALLSRGLDAVQADRDDPAPPLVTAPFGHASQEIVNLLLCGHAVSNVFDDRMDLGDGLCLKGIPTNVEVGFLSLLESLNFCKVGQYLKHPRWPIWVVGSESHYTVLFALDTDVQKENELEDRQSQIRKAFDAHDQSGGGGFISSDALQQLLRDMNINMPRDKLESLCSTDYVVWNEFWQVLMQLDKSLGGLKDSSGLNGRKQFDLYHFNGIAKAVINNSQNAGEALQQRPRLTKLRVSVPPKWTPEEFMADVSSSHNVGPSGKDGSSEPQGPSLSKDEPAQHAPLVDCIRTRWPRSVCNWVGDPPSIV